MFVFQKFDFLKEQSIRFITFSSVGFCQMSYESIIFTNVIQYYSHCIISKCDFVFSLVMLKMLLTFKLKMLLTFKFE